ncbi:Exportin-T [Mollisia scopiformis]|uniref:Exportin-T n=1 Tax=Mollisia scopiformis TaxID=149040 RepID=A0A194XLM5_MOLSC|nr:Exportin-T [Mollisia scopiformis]KUJ21036.1 Exportin-T [Mollisia scopiformis]
MDTQVENAIEIAWNPASDQSLKAQAFEFLNQLRSDPSGQQACISLFTRNPKCSDVVRLVCLDVVNNAIQTQQLDNQSLSHVKETLLEYVRRIYGSGSRDQMDAPHLQNKLTQTLTFLFMASYKQGWETFIDDFLALTSIQNSGARDNLLGTVLYLRILSSIHDEIADVLVSRSNEETKRNTELKDLLRARDVQKIASSWQEILTQWTDRDDIAVAMCLKNVGKWISWIDISLVVNQDFLNILFQLVGRSSTVDRQDRIKDAAIDTFTEIVAKKMKASDKIGMIVFLNLGEVITQLVATPSLNELRTTSEYDTDLAESTAKLINNVIFAIVKVLEDNSVDTQTRAQAEQLIQSFLPLLLRFFSDEYDEICSTVIPSLTDLLTFLRRVQPLPPQYSAMLPPILNAIIQKMRYDETSSWGNEDEQTDEAEFQELRKRLQVLQKSVAAVDENLYIETLSNVVGNTFQRLDQQGGQMDWRDLDLALHEMYLFGELTVPNGGLFAKSAPSSVAAGRLITMMSKMVESGIASFAHPAIQLQYMEICVRYNSFFETETRYIPQVLEHFVRLVHHNHIRVRTRSWYLFHRFAKHLRAHVGNVAETVIRSISDLLSIQAEQPDAYVANEDMSSDESDHSADATFNGQLYLFEAIGSISSTSTTPVETQILYVRTIMEPLFLEIQKSLPRAKAGDEQAVLQVHHVIMALGTLAHGFSDWTPGNAATAGNAPRKEISEEFSRAAEAILIALEALKSSFDVRTAARAAFSRMMGVLGIGMLPLLPQWIDGLLSESSSKDEMAMFLRLLDAVVFGFKKEIYVVLDSLLTPLLQRVFAGLAEPITGTDDEIQLAELRREYLTFIQIILNNELGAVLVSEVNQGFFESLIESVTGLARNVTNGHGSLGASRLAFSVITRMADLWGGPNIATLGPQATSSTLPPSPAFPGFDRFLIERFHPICWEVLKEPSFRPATDAQAKQVLNEIAGLEQTIYTKTGQMFLQHLQQVFFPSMGFDGTDFIKSMTISTDRKGLAGYLQGFLKQRG